MEERKIVNQRIEELRISMKLSQKDFASKIGHSDSRGRSMINNWEQGTQLKSDDLINISKVFGVSVDWLLGISEFQSVKEDMKTANLVTGLNDNCLRLLQGFSTREPEHDLINRLLSSSQFGSRFIPALVNAYFSAQSAIQAGRNVEASKVSTSEIKDSLTKDLEENSRNLRLARLEFSEASMALFDDLLNTPDLLKDIEGLNDTLNKKRIDTEWEVYNNGEH